MIPQQNDILWHELTHEVMIGMHEWRLQHPTATLREIETDLDLRFNRVRARLLEELALQSTAATWQDATTDQQPTCSACGSRLQERARQARTLETYGGHSIRLERSYGVCPACGSGLFPPR